MKKRGKVLRDPFAGPGLLMVEGRQYPFSLEPLWKSDGPPKPGLPVEIEFGQSGQIVAITPIPDPEDDKEKTLTPRGRRRGPSILNKIAAKFHMTR